MAQTIRVTKDMRNIIDFYAKELKSKGLECSLTDGVIVESLLRLWLFQNYSVREADDILSGIDLRS